MKPNEILIARITDYLLKGGMFNPEYMEHEKVRYLLIDCREALAATTPAAESAQPLGSVELGMSNDITDYTQPAKEAQQNKEK